MIAWPKITKINTDSFAMGIKNLLTGTKARKILAGALGVYKSQ